MPRLRPFTIRTPQFPTPWGEVLPITLLAVDTIYGADREHDTPYMTRATVGRLRLHIFWRGDADPDPHDHPWGFWTFPLTSYVEEVFSPPVTTIWHTAAGEVFVTAPQKHNVSVKAFRLHYRPATYTHRVLGRGRGVWKPGPVITLVWREETSRPNWGFLKCRDGRWCWQDWKTYVFGGGKHAPCDDE